jgi:hypothetical protein
MKKEFVPYELALRMKQLGFNERCIMHWWKGKLSYYQMGDFSPTHTSAPIYSQAFRWFREKYGLDSYIMPTRLETKKVYDYYIWFINEEGKNDLFIGMNNEYTHEEAEIACLEKLIEIVEGIES